MPFPKGDGLEAAREEATGEGLTEALWRPVTVLAQHMEAPLRMAVVAQPQRPTVVRVALMPITTVVATPIATVVALPLATLVVTPILTAVAIAMTQHRTPPVLVAKTQRRGQRLSQPPHKIMAASRGLKNASLSNIVRQVTRSPHHHKVLALPIFTRVYGTKVATDGRLHVP